MYSDLLTMLTFVMVEHDMKAAEIEAEYIWGLVHPSLLTGEASYYLTTFSGAVNLLKNLRQTMETATINNNNAVSEHLILGRR